MSKFGTDRFGRWNRRGVWAWMVAVFAVGTSSFAAGGEGATSLDGIWRSVGYQLAVEIEGDHFALYEVTGVSRVKAAEGDLAALKALAGEITVSEDGQRMTAKHAALAAPYTFVRAESLGGPAEVPNEYDALGLFDIVWQTFAENYAFFELRDIDWSAARATWRAKLTADSTEEELFEVVAGMLRSLGDHHVELRAEGFDYEAESSLPDYPLVRAWLEEYAKVEDKGLGSAISAYDYVRSKYITYMAESYQAFGKQVTGAYGIGANEQVSWGMLQDHVGCVVVRAMAGFVEDDDAEAEEHLAALDATLDEVMEDLADAKAMVVDVRFNGGGWDSAAMRIANRFADRRRVAFTKKARTETGFTEPYAIYVEPAGERQFTGPTVLLTSPMTASAAEIFTYCMKVLPHVKQAGLPTMGIHSDMLVRHLPNGWTFSLSNEIYAYADGSVYEKVGIPPEEEIAMFGLDDLEGGVDRIAERAVELVKSMPRGE